jgi:hypothetical protein
LALRLFCLAFIQLIRSAHACRHALLRAYHFMLDRSTLEAVLKYAAGGIFAHLLRAMLIW